MKCTKIRINTDGQVAIWIYVTVNYTKITESVICLKFNKRFLNGLALVYVHIREKQVTHVTCSLSLVDV